MTGDDPARFQVCPTSDRDFQKEYLVQLTQADLSEQFPETDEGEFLLIRSTRHQSLEIHARVSVNDDLYETAVDDQSVSEGNKLIGLDFTVRTALGVPATRDIEYSKAESAGEVEVEPVSNPEQRWERRQLNDLLGVRPQVCRVRMGVFPDLEDKVCRLPSNTLEMIGVDEGDDITIESPRGEQIIRGVKAFEIDRERRETKNAQKEYDEDRYPQCADLLNLNRIRRTEVDLPELWIDEETRSRLGLDETETNGVCHPVRVYRDSWYLFQQQLHEFSIPLVIVLFATGLEVQGQVETFLLWSAGVLLWFGVLFVESRSRL
jgi:antitoxin component of MazEF toxin-antitoxin module